MQIKMKPIIFSTEMVQAILSGRKTQTRRVITRLFRLMGGPDGIKLGGKPVGHAGNKSNPLGFMTGCGIERPPYELGDILWVRETWAQVSSVKGGLRYTYKAKNPNNAMVHKWRPSIHMPKEATRIFLQVTNVRVEQLQDITEADAEAEGCQPMTTPRIAGVGRTYMQGFAELWDSIYIKKREQAWFDNPWVWVIEFEVLPNFKFADRGGADTADQNALQYAT